MTIVASISVASLTVVADQSADKAPLKLNTALKPVVEKTLNSDELKTITDFMACDCRVHGETPHLPGRSFWEELKDFFGVEYNVGMMANAQVTKSLDDDFA